MTLGVGAGVVVAALVDADCVGKTAVVAAKFLRAVGGVDVMKSEALRDDETDVYFVTSHELMSFVDADVAVDDVAAAVVDAAVVVAVVDAAAVVGDVIDVYHVGTVVLVTEHLF